MPLVKRSNFIPHPEGLTVGTLADIQLDEEGRYGTQIKWSFDTEERMPDGLPFRQTYWTTPTLNEKSNLFRLLKAFGEDPEDEKWEVDEVSEFEDLLGRRVQLNIVHKPGDMGPVARIDAILPVPKRRPAGEDGARQEGAREERRPRGEEREPAGAGARSGSRKAEIWKDDD